MNTLGIIALLKKGNCYGIKLKCCNGMLGIYAWDMFILVALGWRFENFPFSCEFNDNETLASYSNGRYDYYDVERIEEYVAFKGAYEIESPFEKYEDYDEVVYRAEIFAILKYCYENYKYNSDIDAFIEKVSIVQEETNILQKSMEEEINDIVSSLEA